MIKVLADIQKNDDKLDTFSWLRTIILGQRVNLNSSSRSFRYCKARTLDEKGRAAIHYTIEKSCMGEGERQRPHLYVGCQTKAVEVGPIQGVRKYKDHTQEVTRFPRT